MKHLIDYSNRQSKDYRREQNKKFLEIVNPILSSFPNIKIAGYYRYYLNGAYITLMTDQLLSEEYTEITENMIVWSTNPKDFQCNYKFSIISFAEKPFCKIMEKAFERGYWNGLVLNRITSDYSEGFYFEGSPDDLILERQLKAHISIFYQFINYFFDNFYDIVFPKLPVYGFHKNGLITSIETPIKLSPDTEKQLLEQLKTDKVYLHFKDEKIPLSKRQYQCLHYLSKGHSYKEISDFLNLSPRTLQYYYQLVKQKFPDQHQRDIVSIFQALTSEEESAYFIKGIT